MKLFILLFFFSGSVFAANNSDSFRHQLNANTSFASFGLDSSNTLFSLGAGYNYLLSGPLQVGAISSIGYNSGKSSTTTTFTFLVGPTINFPFDTPVTDTFFLQGAAGVFYSNSSFSGITSNFVATFLLGKRFQFADHVSYAPSLNLFINNGLVTFGGQLLAFTISF